MLARLQRSIRRLDAEQRLAAVAAVALLVTLVLPWYEPTFSNHRGPNLNAFQTFTFVEAAIFLVTFGVLALLFARTEGRAFHLPGGDGSVILGAGAWAAVLLLWRVFDRPDVRQAVNVGITWGFFFAFLAAASLAAAGWRMRQAHAPEPPNPMADDPATPRDESLSEQLTLPVDRPRDRR